ncbi:MAG: hypothetical protein GY894_01405 [Planctomycetes bacterium]|nr:hypothetical protein [Planctomycetota bacterium]MCP4838006.1 hypothetical protein [Planctomycetota bacterium]
MPRTHSSHARLLASRRSTRRAAATVSIAITSLCTSMAVAVTGDTCSDPAPATIGTNIYTTTFHSDSGAPVEGHCDYLGTFSRDIWFIFNPTKDGLVDASTCASNSFDTSMLVYQINGQSACDATYIGCSGDTTLDDACQPYHSQVDFVVTGGVDYLLRIGGYDPGQFGSGILQIDFEPMDNPCHCPGDIDGNQSIDVDDLLVILADWTTNTNGDIDGNGTTDVDDILLLLSSWGQCPDTRVLNDPFPLPIEAEVATDGVFAVWWAPQFDHDADAQIMFEQFGAIRDDCINNLGMHDPPNLDWCFAYNIYIHHGDDDAYPNGWSNGQGTDPNSMPFLTLPSGLQTDPANTYHEGFHIFQYMSSSPGMGLNDVGWYIETSAQWYMSHNMPGHEAAFIEAGAITANPQLALWHGFGNGADGDPEDWYYLVRQYGMHTLLHYLVDHRGVDPAVVTDCFYSGTTLRPQEHLATEIGLETYRTMFADWAAHNTGGLDYLTSEQVERAMAEAEWVGDPANAHPFVANITDADIGESWTFSPCDDTPPPNPACFAPRGWAYNVIRVDVSNIASYTIMLTGDETGSDGAQSHLQGRIVVMTPSGPYYQTIEMQSPTDGNLSIITPPLADELLVVVASMPEHFTGNQTYGYTLNIERSVPLH